MAPYMAEKTAELSSPTTGGRDMLKTHTNQEKGDDGLNEANPKYAIAWESIM